jgi:N utilization substance protein B
VVIFINILRNRTELDELIAPTISRDTDELGSVEHAVLYLGAYELQNSIEVPYKVSRTMFRGCECHRLNLVK